VLQAGQVGEGKRHLRAILVSALSRPADLRKNEWERFLQNLRILYGPCTPGLTNWTEGGGVVRGVGELFTAVNYGIRFCYG
jgi:hypothetical protein